MLMYLKYAMARRGIKAYQLAPLLKISEGQFSLRLAGRLPFLPGERARLSEFLGLTEEWLFSEPIIPASARIETTMLTPAVETR